MRIEARLLIHAVALVGLLAATSAHALEQGETMQGSIRLAEKQLPLPSGSWILAGLGVQALPPDGAGPFGVIRTAILLQQSGDRVTAIAEFNTNEVSVSGGWSEPSACGDAALEQLQVRYRSRLDAACIFVTSTQPAAGGPPAWQQAFDFAASHHLHIAETMLTAGFTVSDRQDIVDARLSFDPAGFPPETEAQRLLFDWAMRFSPQFAAGMANQLTGPPFDGPLRSALLSDTPSLDRNLLELEALQRAGVITPATSLAQQQTALTEQPRSADVDVVATGGWYYLVTTPLINFATAYGVTQNAPLAVAITLTEQVAHSMLFAANRAGWDYATEQTAQSRVSWPPLMHIGTGDRLAGPSS